MGKVRTELVKRVTMALVDRYPEGFSSDFEHNKRFLVEVNLRVSKRLRNRIAGYISKFKKAQQAPAEETTPPPPEEKAEG